jgi:predicted transcriptional regulator
MLVRHHAVPLGNTCCSLLLLTHFHYLSVFAIEAAKYTEGRFRMAERTESLLTLAAQIVSSHVAHNAVTADQLPELIRTVRQALSNAGKAPVMLKKSVPAVDIKKSVVQDYIVCLDCGAKMKMLKRHLAADHDTTPDEYRTKWNLNSNYPMVSPNYSKVRSKLAKALGLGLEKSPRR